MTIIVDRPNLFDFATSELSQDAFIGWLVSWADPTHRATDPALHATSVALLDRLFDLSDEAGAGTVSKPPAYESVKVYRQDYRIDVLIEVNAKIFIIIEDKTDTREHSGQLERYKASIRQQHPDATIVAIYLKTGDQSNYRSVKKAGYCCFGRKDLLTILNSGAKIGVRNDIFADFHQHLQAIEDAVQSYCTVPISAWMEDPRGWMGFFMELQTRLGIGEWDYVPNASGGFMGFWWHWRDKKYLQLEHDKLCFKIEVADPLQRTAQWEEWHRALIAKNGAHGVRIKKSPRRPGQWMTVAILEDSYLHRDGEGRLAIDQTVAKLRRAESLMDAAFNEHLTEPFSY